MSDDDFEEFNNWLQMGINRKWVSSPTCVTHTGLPSTPEEDQQWDDGYDPCVTGMRILL